MNKLLVFMVILFINIIESTNIIIESTNIKVIPLKLTKNPIYNSEQIEKIIEKTNCQYINSNIQSEIIYLYLTCKDNNKHKDNDNNKENKHKENKRKHKNNFKMEDKIACIIASIYILIISL